MAIEQKEFKSIHIDLENKIFLLNGEPMKMVSQVKLNFIKGKWSLFVTKDEFYKQAETPDKPGVNAELQVNKVSEGYADCEVRLIKKGRLQAIESSVKSSDANSRVTQSKDVVTVEVD